MRISSILGSFKSINTSTRPLRSQFVTKSTRHNLQLRVYAIRHRADAISRRPTEVMSTAESHALVEKLHSTPTKIVLFVTGGGSQAISDMLVVPGASSTVLEARVPYATDATQELLGKPVTSFCSQESAILLARRAYQRAAQLTAPGIPIMGMSCTAALRTVTEKRGDHRIHIACHTGTATSAYDITLEKNARTRGDEEAVCSGAVLSVAAFHCGVNVAQIPEWPALRYTTPSDSVNRGTVSIADPVQELLDGRVSCVEISGPPDDRRVVVDAPRSRALILPGSFNPLHDGHRRTWCGVVGRIAGTPSFCELLACVAATACATARRLTSTSVPVGIGGRELLAAAENAAGEDARCMFELCVQNADKGAIAKEDILKRLEPFQKQGLSIVLTDASLYTLKAKLFPGAQFVLGYDTAVRIVMPKYYGNSEARMAADFALLHANGCGFVVGGRQDGSTDRFLGLEDIDIPDVLKQVGVQFRGISENQFRLDISSTELRKANEQKRT